MTFLQTANSYIIIVRNNNPKIMDILRQNYPYIYPEDTEVFQQFIAAHLEQEFKEEHPMEIPLKYISI